AASGTSAASNAPVVTTTMFAATTTGKFDTHVSIAGAQSATFTQWSLQAPVDLTVTGPTGHKFTPAVAATDPNVTFVEQTTSNGLSMAQYTLIDPSPGDWTFSIDTAPNTVTFGKFGEASPLQTSLAISGFTFPRGAPIVARVTVAPTSAVVTASTATFLAPDGIQQAVVLRDDGLGGDTVAGDHVFSGTFTLPTRAGAVGRWSVDGSARGTFSTLPFDRTNTALFDVTSGEITTTGTFAQTLVDSGNDGIVDALDIDVGLHVDQPGTFVVKGKLIGPGGKFSGDATTQVTANGAGTHTATLAFSAEGLSQGGVSGK